MRLWCDSESVASEVQNIRKCIIFTSILYHIEMHYIVFLRFGASQTSIVPERDSEQATRKTRKTSLV